MADNELLVMKPALIKLLQLLCKHDYLLTAYYPEAAKWVCHRCGKIKLIKEPTNDH